MASLDSIKIALDSNKELSEDVKNDLLELITIFNDKFPSVSLSNLERHLKTLKIKKLNRFLNDDISMYDHHNNILFFNTSRMNEGFDYRHVLMYELINIISSNNYQTGFNNDGRFEALNIGYTEILANYLVGNEGDKLFYPNEAIMANMIGIVVGSDNMFESYFNNNAELLLNCLMKVGIKI